MENSKIIIKVPGLVKELGINTFQFSKKANISQVTAYSLMNEIDPPKRIDIPTLTKLCIFFDCGVGDLLEFTNSIE